MKIDLQKLGETIGPRFSKWGVYVDTNHHPPTVVEFRSKATSVQVHKFGAERPRVEVRSLKPQDFDLLRAVLDELEKGSNET